jgi:hypothetical protein
MSLSFYLFFYTNLSTSERRQKSVLFSARYSLARRRDEAVKRSTRGGNDDDSKGGGQGKKSQQ